MRVKVCQRESIHRFVVHRQEDLSGSYRVRHECLRDQLTTLGAHHDSLTRLNADTSCVGRIEFEIDFRRIEFPQHG